MPLDEQTWKDSCNALVFKVCLLLIYVLVTSNAISGSVSTCYIAHTWQLYRAAPLGDQGDQAISTMT